MIWSLYPQPTAVVLDVVPGCEAAPPDVPGREAAPPAVPGREAVPPVLPGREGAQSGPRPSCWDRPQKLLD